LPDRERHASATPHERFSLEVVPHTRRARLGHQAAERLGDGVRRGLVGAPEVDVADRDVDCTRTEASKETRWSSKCVPVMKCIGFRIPQMAQRWCQGSSKCVTVIRNLREEHQIG
jgi:hypothetical protein